MNAAVIGYGSIGARHARILSDMGIRTSIVSQRPITHPNAYASVEELFDNERPEYIVIANKTKDHMETLQRIEKLGFRGTVLVEKPLADRIVGPGDTSAKECYVGYNLRFHPILQQMKKELQAVPVLSANVYVGQYLPDWRPNSDYRLSYSASRAEGGGVLRDLSHELDYMIWLFGDWRAVASLEGKLSSLEIDSEDHCAMMLEFERCPNAVVQLNYSDRVGQRRVVVNTDEKTYIADFVQHTLQINGEHYRFEVNRDDTYAAMHKALLSGDAASVCTMEEALKTMRLIEAAERSNAARKWVDHA